MENILNQSTTTLECQEKTEKVLDDIDYIMSRLSACSKQKLNNIGRLIDKNISDNKDFRSAFTTYITI